MIAKPFSPGNAYPAEEVAREHLGFDKAMIGSCTNGSYDDLLPYFKRSEHNERGADVLHGTGGPLNVMDLRSPNRFGPDPREPRRNA